MRRNDAKDEAPISSPRRVPRRVEDEPRRRNRHQPRERGRRVSRPKHGARVARRDVEVVRRHARKAQRGTPEPRSEQHRGARSGAVRHSRRRGRHQARGGQQGSAQLRGFPDAPFRHAARERSVGGCARCHPHQRLQNVGPHGERGKVAELSAEHVVEITREPGDQRVQPKRTEILSGTQRMHLPAAQQREQRAKRREQRRGRRRGRR